MIILITGEVTYTSRNTQSSGAFATKNFSFNYSKSELTRSIFIESSDDKFEIVKLRLDDYKKDAATKSVKGHATVVVDNNESLDFDINSAEDFDRIKEFIAIEINLAAQAIQVNRMRV